MEKEDGVANPSQQWLLIFLSTFLIPIINVLKKYLLPLLMGAGLFCFWYVSLHVCYYSRERGCWERTFAQNCKGFNSGSKFVDPNYRTGNFMERYEWKQEIWGEVTGRMA